MALRLERVTAGDGAPRLLELVAQLLDLRFELAPLGITINNVAPGAIETPINAAMLKQPEKLARKQRPKRMP